jgi:hypothetical protein
MTVDVNASSDLQDNLDLPWASLYYTTSTMHCMTTSLADGGTGLVSMWGHQRATAMLADGGFREVEIREIATDPFNNHYVARK